MQDPAKYHGESIVLAGDSLPVADVQRIYSAHSGASAGTLPRFVGHVFGEWVAPELGKMMRWFSETVSSNSTYVVGIRTLTVRATPGISRGQCRADEARVPGRHGPRDVGEEVVCKEVRVLGLRAHEINTWCTLRSSRNIFNSRGRLSHKHIPLKRKLDAPHGI
jgi:hypothetical protein